MGTKKHLNVGAGCIAAGLGEADARRWTARGGPVVFAPFAADTDYFASDQTFMLNLRLRDLAGLIGQLRNDGIPVETRDEWNDPQIASFARIHDPEGNPIAM